MFVVNRRYTIGTFERYYSEVESILNTFRVTTIKHSSYETMLLGKNMRNVYFECVSEEEVMDRLIEYFQTKFDGYASITF